MTRHLFELLWSLCCYAIAYLLPLDISGDNFGKWAVITGGTQGIGRAYSIALAKRGKNLFILSRTVSKMEDLKTELEEKFNIQVDYLSVDFSLPVETYLQKLQDKLHEVRHDGKKIADDIGILINCVGQLPYAYDTFWQDRERRARERPHEPYSVSLQKSLNINCLSQIVMTSEIMHLMINKKKHPLNQYKGIIISLSSFTGTEPLPYWATYTACKGFNKYFSDSLARSNWWTANDLIIQTQHPMEVATSMAPTEIPSLRSPSADKYVEFALKTVGWMAKTYGWPFHDYRSLMAQIGGGEFGVNVVTTRRYKNITAGRLRKRAQNLNKLKKQLSKTLSDSLVKHFGSREEAKARKKLSNSKRFFF